MSWFSRRALPTFEEHVKPRFAGKPTCYLEIGVWKGDSLEWMLSNVLTHDDSLAVAVDPWAEIGRRHRQDEMDSHYEMALARVQQYGPKCQVFRCCSSRWLRQNGEAWSNRFDMIHIDGDHTAVACLDDIVLSWPLLKVGGMLLIDDYKTCRGNYVKTAVDAVMPTVFAPYVEQIVDAGRVGYLKTGDVLLTTTDTDGNNRIGLPT